MKKFLFLGMAGLLAAGIVGCKDDVLDGGRGASGLEDDGNYLYVKAGIALPTTGGTRSSTDTPDDTGNSNNNQTNSDGTYNDNGEVGGAGRDDFEYGYDYENSIRSILLVFASPDESGEDCYITHTIVSGISNMPESNNGILDARYDFAVNGQIKHSEMAKAYGENGILSGSGNSNNNNNPVVYVYAYCNYTARIINRFDSLANSARTDVKSWIHWEGLVEEGPSKAGEQPLTTNTIWSPKSFLMTNAKKCEVYFPKTIGEWDKYSDKNHPFKITSKQTGDPEDSDELDNPIKVERVAARIDFRDGHPDGFDDNTYPLYVDSNNNGEIDPGEDLNIFSITLNRMCLVNMNRNYHYLRRVSKDGLAAGAEICGLETPTNYVVDIFNSIKNTVKGITADNGDKYFNFPLYGVAKDSNNEDSIFYNRNNWYVDKISDVLNPKGKDDTWSGSADNRYKIWRYVTENTIPGIDQQKVQQSTGVVFKGRIVLGNDIDDENASKYISQDVIDAIKRVNSSSNDDNMDDLQYLYSFQGILYYGWESIVKAAFEDGENGPLSHAVNQVLKYWHKVGNSYIYDPDPQNVTDVLSSEIYGRWLAANDENNPDERYADFKGLKMDITKENFRRHSANAGITVYCPTNENDGDGWGYYCYYFYWNRHNDNLKSGRMGPMEFATVRNNVYKLSVTKINQLGHPRVMSDDPDPVDPEDPDEDPIDYIQVQIQVLPWVVRENNIEF